jgi:Cu-Zn family superoxide dismutase
MRGTTLAAAVVGTAAAGALGACDAGRAPDDTTAAPAPVRQLAAGSPRRGMPQRYTLAGAAASPDGIAYEPFSGQLYVGSLGDGTIFRAHVMDTVLTPFLPGGRDGRVRAAGLAVDGGGRLLVAGDTTGLLFVYDAGSGALLRRLAAARGEGPPPRLTDVAVTYGDVAYVTDASRGVVYRVDPDPGRAERRRPLRPWLDLRRALARGGASLSLSAIDATPDGAYLVVASGGGTLYRVDTRTRGVAEIALAGDSVPGAEGLLLVESALYVIRSAAPQLLKVQLASDLTAGVLTDTLTIPALAAPTALVEAGSRLLVVDSQAGRRGGGRAPAPPFTVASVPTP